MDGRGRESCGLKLLAGGQRSIMWVLREGGSTAVGAFVISETGSRQNGCLQLDSMRLFLFPC